MAEITTELRPGTPEFDAEVDRRLETELRRREHATARSRVPVSAGRDETIAALDLERAIMTPEVAAILGVHPVTLEQMRYRGEGPRYFKVGRMVRYRLRDVLAYRDAHTVGREP